MEITCIYEEIALPMMYPSGLKNTDPGPLDDIWRTMEVCSQRGMYFLDEAKGEFLFTSYREIFMVAKNYAAALYHSGVTTGDYVIISAKTAREFTYAWVGLVLLGATPVPLPPREVFSSDEFYQSRIQPIVSEFDTLICLDEEEEKLKNIGSDRKSELRLITYSALAKEADSATSGTNSNHTVPLHHTEWEDVAFVQFTSGSTGNPKGIIIRYSNLLTNILDIWSRLQVDPENLNAATWLPLYHDMGLVGFFLGCLLTLTNLYLMSPQQFAKRPFQFIGLLSEKEIEICGMPNFALEWILRKFQPGKEYPYRFEKLKWVGIGAEPVHSEIIIAFEAVFNLFGLRKGVISPCYGLAEATLAVSLYPPLESFHPVDYRGQSYPTVGKILDHVEIRLAKKSENDREGIVHIRGKSVAREALINGTVKYLLDQDGYYNTHDNGFWDGEELVIIGREDDMFIINGENHYPYDIEAWTRNIREISRNRVACLALESNRKDENRLEIYLFYESRKMDQEEREILDKKILSEVLKNTGICPDRIVAVASKTIPVTTSGKIQRNKLKELYLGNLIPEDKFLTDH